MFTSPIGGGAVRARRSAGVALVDVPCYELRCGHATAVRKSAGSTGEIPDCYRIWTYPIPIQEVGYAPVTPLALREPMDGGVNWPAIFVLLLVYRHSGTRRRGAAAARALVTRRPEIAPVLDIDSSLNQEVDSRKWNNALWSFKCFQEVSSTGFRGRPVL
ncbi:hypothetical protein EVAR_82306_1 [Eumeta japonica]|uniref:Uncharacterized protein n=1 Tax=Eumeta variegata TaxID=151549 RepID=A0A4C1VYJ9_EUMVA|nr:hypothetical protein EVAR_82306_1 [Eumeta japonica]